MNGGEFKSGLPSLGTYAGLVRACGRVRRPGPTRELALRLLRPYTYSAPPSGHADVHECTRSPWLMLGCRLADVYLVVDEILRWDPHRAGARDPLEPAVVLVKTGASSGHYSGTLLNTIISRRINCTGLDQNHLPAALAGLWECP